jgi:steroid 5-alpha reductase family enzyme
VATASMTTAPTTFDALSLWLLGWGLAAASMLLAWARQRSTRDATTVDVVWAADLGLLACLYALLGAGAPPRRALLAILVGAWSVRLGLHLLRTRVLAQGHGEDGRYARLRERWGRRAQRNFFWLYQGQALLAALLSLPFLLAACDPDAQLGALELCAALLLALSVAGEALADRQLARFKADPAQRGRTYRSGLWRFSRHPNYFFEWLAWCAFALLALGAPAGWLALSAPALMLLLLWKVTGIPPAEAQALRSRGADYLEYQRTTSSFFPWIPGRGRA